MVVRLVGVILAAILVPAITFAKGDFVSSLILDQPAPVVGDMVTFTAHYPQEAARQQHNTQFHNQPNVQVTCPGFQQTLYMNTKQKISGGWEGVTYPVALPAGYCSAILYYFDSNAQLHQLAWIQFTVGT